MALGFELIEDMAFTAAEDNEVVETVVDGALAGAGALATGAGALTAGAGAAALVTGAGAAALVTGAGAAALSTAGSVFFASTLTGAVVSELLPRNEKNPSDFAAAGAGADAFTTGSAFFASTLAGATVFTGASGDLLNTTGVAGLLERRDPYNEPE